MPMIQYATERLLLCTLRPDDADLLYEYYKRNSEFLKPWEPLRDESYFTKASIMKMIEAESIANHDRSALRLYIYPKDKKRIIGFLALTNIVYGPFLSCFLGYKLDWKETNKGYMTEAVRKITEIAFKEYGLHRIESNVIPSNIPSRRVMEKLNFQNEGMSIQYLRINEKWEDHIHYVLLNHDLE